MKAKIISLPGGGFGGISRVDRLAHGQNSVLVKDAEIALSDGTYNIDATSTDVVRCGDGRPPITRNAGTQLFGGTAGLIKSMAISGLNDTGASAESMISRVVKKRTQNGINSGAHSADTHGDASLSGCGECDGSQLALTRYVDNESALKPLVESLWQELGYFDEFGDMAETYDEIVQNISELLEKSYFANGKAHVQAVAAEAGEQAVEKLQGMHAEVVWVINCARDTMFDQGSFLDEYYSFDDDRSGFQVFWEDQWAIRREFEIMSNATSELKQLLLADIVRRVATAANLTAADLNLIILS